MFVGCGVVYTVSFERRKLSIRWFALIDRFSLIWHHIYLSLDLFSFIDQLVVIKDILKISQKRRGFNLKMNSPMCPIECVPRYRSISLSLSLLISPVALSKYNFYSDHSYGPHRLLATSCRHWSVSSLISLWKYTFNDNTKSITSTVALVIHSRSKSVSRNLNYFVSFSINSTWINLITPFHTLSMSIGSKGANCFVYF